MINLFAVNVVPIQRLYVIITIDTHILHLFYNKIKTQLIY